MTFVTGRPLKLCVRLSGNVLVVRVVEEKAMKRLLVSLVLLVLGAAVLGACSSEPQTQPIEVTRIVGESIEVEVTRLVETVQEVEVTRIVEVEVTRLVDVVITATAEPTPEPTETPEVSTMTAEIVLNVLADSGLPIGDSIVYTAETDPNELLGRPGGYVGKVNFRDTRLPVEYQDEFDTGDGGSIEVFPTVEAATLRAEYIAAIGAASPAFSEYHVQNGNVLLRLSRRLTPDQVEEYSNVMANLFE